MTSLEKNIPYHVGIIMDGNGRWATSRGLKRSEGHKEGAKNLKSLVEHIFRSGVKVLSLYAFSSENFKREKEEVNYLMNLFMENFKREFSYLKKQNVKVVFSGRREPLRDDVLASMDKIVEETKNGTLATLNICINYSGQEEIVDMTKRIATLVKKEKLKVDEINKDTIYHYLYQDLPPADFIIRTSGEYRISNFLLYQSSYAEYYFPKIYFPDFNEKEFDLALEEYQKRNRRFGGNAK